MAPIIDNPGHRSGGDYARRPWLRRGGSCGAAFRVDLPRCGPYRARAPHPRAAAGEAAADHAAGERVGVPYAAVR